MNKERAAWKKYLLTAAVAFILGLLPYFVLLVSTGAEELSVGQYVRGVSEWLWGLAARYAPHILTLYILSVAVLIFLEGQNPDRTVMWLLVLALLPVFGVALYLILGPDLRRMKTRKLFKPTKAYPTIVTPREKRIPPGIRKISVLAFRSGGAEIMERGEVRILIDGAETFGAITEALNDAKRYINIEYFIFKDDRIGTEIADILCCKAEDGVKVRMIVDGVGSWKIGRKLIKRLQASGVDFRSFMPVSFPSLRSGINYRNHRKIVVVDGDVAFTGGLNVGVEYLGEGKLGNWRDTHAGFRGEVVYALNTVFLEDWAIASGEELSPNLEEFAPTRPDACADMPFLPVQVVASGSGAPWHSIEQMYFEMITEADKRIWITSPYLVPDEAILEALRVSALSGVDVRILIPEKSDHFLVYWAGRSNIENLLRAGVRIWSYKKGFVHAKTLLMDDTIASVGTANLDNRSLEINFEVQTFIYDRKTCADFTEQFLKDIEDADERMLSEWERRPFWQRVLESLGRLWSAQI